MEKLRRNIFDTIQIGNKNNLISNFFDWFITIAIFFNLFIVIFKTFDESIPYLPLLKSFEFLESRLVLCHFILWNY